MCIRDRSYGDRTPTGVDLINVCAVVHSAFSIMEHKDKKSVSNDSNHCYYKLDNLTVMPPLTVSSINLIMCMSQILI